MVSRRVKVINTTGLHLKPAANFSKVAEKFESVITFTFNGVTANAKSILSILGACVRQGDEIEIVCEGSDEQEALDALCTAVESGLED